MRRLAIAATFAGALMAACGGGGLSEQERTDYMAGCTGAGSSEAECQCNLDYFDEQGVESAADITPEIVVGAVTACVGQTG